MVQKKRKVSSKAQKLPVNYSVKNIVDSILSDNRKALKLTVSKKKKRFIECQNLVGRYPDLKAILSAAYIRKFPIEGSAHYSRVGVLPPDLVIIDSRIKDLCTLPYWTVYNDQKGKTFRRFGRCPGYGRLPGCPPNSACVDEVQKILDGSDLFVVLQTRLQSDRWKTRWKFTVLNMLASKIEQLLGPGSVTARFGSGPCTACSRQPCLYSKPCKTPSLRTTSLESLGICVDRVCEDLAVLTGAPAWKIKWLKHFGLPQQHPQKWKYVTALSVRLP